MPFQFGTGVLFVNPTSGNLATNPTPRKPLTLQDISIEFSQDLKELKGQNKVADDIAPGDIKVSGKFSFGRHDIDLYNQIMFADNRQNGSKQIVYNETHVVPTATTPATRVASHSYSIGDMIYDGKAVQRCTTAGVSGSDAPAQWNDVVGGTTVDGSVTWTCIGTAAASVSVTNSNTFATDLGVINASTGLALLRTSSASPAQGYYSVSNGAYTFNSADVGQTVFINYAYNSTQGYTVQVNSQLMGYGPVFELWLAEPYQQVNGLSGGIHLFACRAGKFSMDNKRDGYKQPSVDYQAFANLAGQVAEFWNPGN